MLEDESAVVPDGVVFGILGEQGGGQAERFGRVLVGLDLNMLLATDVELTDQESVPLPGPCRPGPCMRQSA